MDFRDTSTIYSIKDYANMFAEYFLSIVTRDNYLEKDRKVKKIMLKTTLKKLPIDNLVLLMVDNNLSAYRKKNNGLEQYKCYESNNMCSLIINLAQIHSDSDDINFMSIVDILYNSNSTKKLYSFFYHIINAATSEDVKEMTRAFYYFSNHVTYRDSDKLHYFIKTIDFKKYSHILNDIVQSQTYDVHSSLDTKFMVKMYYWGTIDLGYLYELSSSANMMERCMDTLFANFPRKNHEVMRNEKCVAYFTKCYKTNDFLKKRIYKFIESFSGDNKRPYDSFSYDINDIKAFLKIYEKICFADGVPINDSLVEKICIYMEDLGFIKISEVKTDMNLGLTYSQTLWKNQYFYSFDLYDDFVMANALIKIRDDRRMKEYIKSLHVDPE